MRFVHIADIHFDSPFTALTSKRDFGTKRRLEWFREFAARVEEIKGSPLDLSNIEEVELTRTIDLWMISQLNQPDNEICHLRQNSRMDLEIYG